MSSQDSKRQITLQFLAETSDVNFGGKVHGGAVMKWIDQAGYTCASQWSGKYCVTVYVGGINFVRPVQIGDIVQVCAKIIHTGTTSMTIDIDVHSGNPRQDNRNQTTRCVIVFVAVDEDGNPVEVPKWSPKTNNDRALEEYAKELKKLGKELQDKLEINDLIH